MKGINMINNESKLLAEALLYENGHNRRTQHILKVYALAKLLGEQSQLSSKNQKILNAAAILHDIPIKYCKENYNGDASQPNQQKEAPKLVQAFLEKANYSLDYFLPVLELVLKHHDYTSPRSQLLQLLIEADIIINCYESDIEYSKAESFLNIFTSDLGKKLFLNYLQEKAH